MVWGFRFGSCEVVGWVVQVPKAVALSKAYSRDLRHQKRHPKSEAVNRKLYLDPKEPTFLGCFIMNSSYKSLKR